MKRPIRLTIIVTAVAVLVILLVAGAYWWAAGLASVAKKGKAEAAAGATRLASLDATGAASQFGAAKRSFSRAKGMLGPDWLGAAVGAVPLVGRQYSTARALVAIGLDGSTAGAELAAALQAPTARAGASPTSGLGSLLTTRRGSVDAALAALLDVADRAASLDERGLVSPLAKEVRSVKAALRGAAPFLDRFRALLPLEKYLLSSTHRILVVSQNGAELRPTGGFTGSYGVIEVGPTGVRLEEYRDIYALPDPPYLDVFLLPDLPDRFRPPPGARMTSDFGFREANWSIDFPTSARAMLGFWRDYRQPPVDGIVIVDTIAMEYLLEALGPVRVPSFSETFTPENLLTRLLYYTSVKGGEGRKDVLVALAKELEQRVLAASPGELVKVAQALAKAADAKHVQVYFTDPGAEAAVVALGWSGRIAPPGGTTDLLVISNAMNLGSKVNMAMKQDHRLRGRSHARPLGGVDACPRVLEHGALHAARARLLQRLVARLPGAGYGVRARRRRLRHRRVGAPDRGPHVLGPPRTDPRGDRGQPRPRRVENRRCLRRFCVVRPERRRLAMGAERRGALQALHR